MDSFHCCSSRVPHLITTVTAVLCMFLLCQVLQIVDSYCEDDDEGHGGAGSSSSSSSSSSIESTHESGSDTNNIKIIVTKAKQFNSSVYIIPKSAAQFQVTCVSNVPVDWTYIGLGVSAQELRFERGRNTNATCFYYSIAFPVVTDDITGEYICYAIAGYSGGKPDNNSSSGNSSRHVILFAGNNNDGYLIHRKSGLTIQGSKENDEKVLFPCATNNPNVTAVLWRKISNEQPQNATIGFSKWQKVPTDDYTFDPLTGIQLISPVNQVLQNTTRIGNQQASFKCDTTFSNQDAVYFIYKKPAEYIVKPDTNSLHIPVNNNGTGTYHHFLVHLECYSTSSIDFTINTNSSELNPNVNMTVSPAMELYGYNYGLVFELKSKSSGESLNDSDYNLSNLILNVSCVQEEEEGDNENEERQLQPLHSWILTFINQEDFTPSLVFDSNSTTVTCSSKSPDTIQFYYVFCDLMAKCNFLRPCLQNSSEWACPENQRKIPKVINSNESSVTIHLYEYSGALSCVGVDVNETIYFHRTASGTLNLDDNQTDIIGLNIIGINNELLIVGTLIQVECTASKRFFLNKLSIELWTNGKFSDYIAKDSISNDEDTVIAGMYVSRLQFKIQDINANEIVCTAQRYDSNETDRKSIKIDVASRQTLQGSFNWTTVILAIITVTFLIILIALLIFWRKCYTKPLASLNSNGIILTDLEFEELQRFREGCASKLSEDVLRSLDGNSYAQIVPYDNSLYEIPVDKLQIDRSQNGILGIGEYGIVYKGLYDNGSFGIPVAVKELKPNAQYVYLRALLAEIKIMIYVGHHENIVKFFGACTQRKLDACLVLKLYPYGTLEKYLRDRRKQFNYQNCLQVSELVMRNSGSFGYVNPTELNVADLMKWSFQISNALEYLSHKKVIHGDLSTRNVLLDETLTAKVSDFGLARPRYNNLDFPRLCEMPLPWRWMSPESLSSLEFTHQSDVWSYGVTLWEMYSLGEVPYLEKMLNAEFLRELENGYRLEQPAFATDPMYQIMNECWLVPIKRITISEVKTRLENLINSEPAAATSGTHVSEEHALNYKKLDFESSDDEEQTNLS